MDFNKRLYKTSHYITHAHTSCATLSIYIWLWPGDLHRLP